MGERRVILLPGMGVDGRMFGAQRAAGFEFECPPMPMPGRGDTMADYAARVRDLLRLDGPCVVGGVSFGGMVACELSRITRAECVLLIASCASVKAIPGYLRPVEWVSRIIPDFLIRRRAVLSARMMAHFEGLDDAQYQLLRTMVTDTEVTKLRRFARLILNWKAPNSYPCPIHQIHGSRDMVIPLRRVRPEEVVPGGGHLINMTHSREVNAFVARYLGKSEA